MFINFFTARLRKQEQRGQVGGMTLEQIVAVTRQDLVACKWELCEFGRSAIVNMTDLALLYQGVNLTVMRHR